MREGIPFYLQSNLPNVITGEHIELFGKENPHLQPFLKAHDIQLRKLQLPYFHSYCAWIIGQVISVRVAEVIQERFEALVPEITPSAILEIDNQVLRGIGLSTTKVETIKRMARLFLEKSDEIEDLLSSTTSSAEIIKYFTQIKGIGPWTVEMFLIFNCTKLDVFSYRDLVVRKGMQKLYDLENIPSIPEARKLGSGWGEFATIGTLLSWAVMGE